MVGSSRRGASRLWRRLTEGLQMHELWAQFRADARDGYAHYAAEIDWEAIAARSRWRRPVALARVLAWAMILKLTPARRLFLLLACLLALPAVLDAQLWGLSRASEFLIGFGMLLVLLALELADRVGMKRDLELAREIQSWLLPAEPPRLAGVDVAFATRPANTVGGDFYDVLPRQAPDGGGPRLLLAVADVAGKSVPAALLMATFAASFRALASAGAGLADLVGGLNASTCARSQGGRRFVTAFVAEYDPRARRLLYVGAGHNPPLLRRRAGRLERLTEGGIPLGIQGGVAYEAVEATLEAGDLLVVYTDGVIDAVDEQGRRFGEERLQAQVSAAGGAEAAAVLKRLREVLTTYTGPARQNDDITWLLLRVP